MRVSEFLGGSHFRFSLTNKGFMMEKHGCDSIIHYEYLCGSQVTGDYQPDLPVHQAYRWMGGRAEQHEERNPEGGNGRSEGSRAGLHFKQWCDMLAAVVKTLTLVIICREHQVYRMANHLVDLKMVDK